MCAHDHERYLAAGRLPCLLVIVEVTRVTPRSWSHGPDRAAGPRSVSRCRDHECDRRGHREPLREVAATDPLPPMRRTYRRDELRRGLAPQTQPMLTRQLRELDADGVS